MFHIPTKLYIKFNITSVRTLNNYLNEELTVKSIFIAKLLHCFPHLTWYRIICKNKIYTKHSTKPALHALLEWGSRKITQKAFGKLVERG